MLARAHHSGEHDREGDLHVLRCDGLLAGIHVCLRNEKNVDWNPSNCECTHVLQSLALSD